MKYKIHSFRNAQIIFENDLEFKYLWSEVLEVLDNISYKDIEIDYESVQRKGKKSISEPINKLIDQRLCDKGWNRQSKIFKDENYSNSTWTLDFAKGTIAIEVAFNHGGNVSWNLIKPVLSGELNHIEKEIQTKAGIIIAATNLMKKYGGFDGAVGSYEKYLEYLDPLRNMLTVPLIIIGLEPPLENKKAPYL